MSKVRATTSGEFVRPEELDGNVVSQSTDDRSSPMQSNALALADTRRPMWTVAAVLASVLIHANPAAQCETQQLLPADPAAWHHFGSRVAMGDRVIAVQAPGDDQKGPDFGAVYLFEELHGIWRQTAKVVQSWPNRDVGFGNRIAVNDDVLVIGAYGAESAYVIENGAGGWHETAIFSSPGGGPAPTFGGAVAVDGKTIAVGAPFWSAPPAIKGGAVFVYEQGPAGWTRTGMLTVPGLSFGDVFGGLVDIDGDTIAVGQGDSSGTGAVHVFERGPGGWASGTKLVSSDGMPYDQFGSAIALEDDWLAVGSPDSDSAGMSSGAVYMFHREGVGWIEKAKILGPSPLPLLQVGSEVAMASDRLLVGTTYNVYLYEQLGGTWSFAGAVAPASPLPSGWYYAAAVAAAGTKAVVGADDYSGVAASGGAAFVFHLDGPAASDADADQSVVSVSGGDSQTLFLKTCTKFAGDTYLLAGSASGSLPGTTFNGLLVPLNVDAYTLFTVAHPNQPPYFSKTKGMIPASGSATSTITFAPGGDPSLVGITLEHAFLVLDLQTPGVLASTSNAVPLTLGP